MGEVYVAEQLSTGKQRALKMLHPELAHYPALRARFAQEARVASLIDSEHVVEVVAAGVDASTGRPWLAMELLDGVDLARMVATSGPVDPRMVRDMMAQICHALAAAHRAGIVHRDLKPENIFVARSRQQSVPFKVKVLDFGIAKLLAEARSASHTTSAMGTPLWMAPEQSDGRAAVGPQADVWALGLLVFWMLTGVCYWREASAPTASVMTLMREVLAHPLEPASVRAQEYGRGDRIPAGIDRWFAACVARDPQQRFPNAEHAMAALGAALPATAGPYTGLVWPAGAGVTPPFGPSTAATPGPYGASQPGLASTAGPAAKSSRWAWIAGLAGVAIVLGLGVVSVGGGLLAWYLGAFGSTRNTSAPSEAQGPDLSGGYTISEGMNPPGGGMYRGTVLITRQADAYRVAWTIMGGQGYEGTGVTLDRTLAVGFAQGQAYGVCAFRIAGGKLAGPCVASTDASHTFEEHLAGPATLSGVYAIEKSRAGRRGTVTIAPHGDVYDVTWGTDAGGARGVGIKRGEQLLVGWSDGPGSCGVVAYGVASGQLSGPWAMRGGDQTGRETIVKQ